MIQLSNNVSICMAVRYDQEERSNMPHNRTCSCNYLQTQFPAGLGQCIPLSGPIHFQPAISGFL